jgi:hypothetical protein
MSNSEDGTRVWLQLNIQLSIFGVLLYPFVYREQRKEAGRVLKEFKEYVESLG